MRKGKFIIGSILATLLFGCSGIEDEMGENNNTSKNEQEPGEKSNSKPEEEKVVYMLPRTRSIQLTEEQRKYVVSNNEFGFRLFGELCQEKEGNYEGLLTSPMGVCYVLGMINSGAIGQTSQEIKDILGFGKAETQAINEFYKQIIDESPLVDNAINLKMANGIFTNHVIDNEFVRLNETFVQDIQYYYKANVSTMDLSQKSSVDVINKWCNEQTEGMIPKIKEYISANTRLILMNAIYFQATWSEKFDNNDTKEEIFGESGANSFVPMMHRKALAQYTSNDIFKTIRLPYGSGDKWSMMVLLPIQGKSVEDILSVLDEKSWNENKQSMSNHIVDIKIPRFTTKSHSDLINVIRKLGAPSMFTIRHEFPKISHEIDSLAAIGQFFQDAVIEIAEEGTKASAVSVAEFCGTSSDPSITESKRVDFYANRPFVYLIEEASSGAIFFIGTYRGENE